MGWGFFKKIGKGSVKVIDVLGNAGVPIASQVDAIIDSITKAKNADPGTSEAVRAEATAIAGVQSIAEAMRSIEVPTETQIVLRKKFTIAALSVIGVLSTLISVKFGIPSDVAADALAAIVTLAAAFIGVQGLIDLKGTVKPPKE